MGDYPPYELAYWLSLCGGILGSGYLWVLIKWYTQGLYDGIFGFLAMVYTFWP